MAEHVHHCCALNLNDRRPLFILVAISMVTHSMRCGIFLGIIDEVNAALRNDYFATPEETRIK
jgi:hypothetical protein